MALVSRRLATRVRVVTSTSTDRLFTEVMRTEPKSNVRRYIESKRKWTRATSLNQRTEWSASHQWFWSRLFPSNSHETLAASLSESASIYLLTDELLGCVAGRPVIGWQLCTSNSTPITGGCGVGHLLCFRWLTLLSPTLPTTTGQYIISVKQQKTSRRLPLLWITVPLTLTAYRLS